MENMWITVVLICEFKRHHKSMGLMGIGGSTTALDSKCHLPFKSGETEKGKKWTTTNGTYGPSRTTSRWCRVMIMFGKDDEEECRKMRNKYGSNHFKWWKPQSCRLKCLWWILHGTAKAKKNITREKGLTVAYIAKVKTRQCLRTDDQQKTSLELCWTAEEERPVKDAERRQAWGAGWRDWLM